MDTEYIYYISASNEFIVLRSPPPKGAKKYKELTLVLENKKTKKIIANISNIGVYYICEL